MSNTSASIQRRRQGDGMCSEMQKYASQWLNPVRFSSRRYALFWKYLLRNSPTEPGGDSATNRELTFRGRRGAQPPQKKSLEFQRGALRISWFQQQTGLRLYQMTSFPALLQLCSWQLRSCAGAEQAGGRRVIAPPDTRAPNSALYIYAPSWRRRADARQAAGLVWCVAQGHIGRNWAMVWWIAGGTSTGTKTIILYI